MDTSRLERGELIAGVSGLALLIIMFLFSWFEVPGELGDLAGAAGVDTGFNAWDSFDLISWVLFITVIVSVGFAAEKVMGMEFNLPVAGSALTAGLGLLSLILVIYRVLDPPEDLDRGFGLWLGLLAVAGIAYGGWLGMQEESGSVSASPPPPPPAEEPPAPAPGGPPPA